GNLIGDNSACTLMNATADDQQGNSGNPLDPQLNALSEAGGPVATHVPQEGSPAIDRGVNGNCPPRDARGTNRPLNGLGTAASPQCDVGAVEAGRCTLQFDALGFSNLKLQGLDPFLPTTVTGRVENLGPDFAPGVSLVGTLPDGVQLLAVDVSVGSCTAA